MSGRSRPGPGSRRRGSPLPTAVAIGEFLRNSRESQNLSQEQLAALTTRGAGPVSRAMISAVERGLHLPGLEVLLTLSRALHVSPTEVLERLELAREAQIEADGVAWRELERHASRAFWAADYRRAVAYYDAALRGLAEDLELAGRDRDLCIARIEVPRATALRRHGAISAARAAAERAISLADGEDALQSQGYVVLASILWQTGCLPLARDVARRAVELAERSGDATVCGYALMQHGVVLQADDSPDQARAAYLAALEHVRESGDHKHLITIEGNLGACMQDVGRPDGARTHYRRAVELARRHNLPAREALWLTEIGRLAVLQRREDEAERHLGAALRIAKPLDLTLVTFRAEWWRHRLVLGRDHGDADRHRIAFLRKLFVRLEEHRGIEEVQAFRERYCVRRGTDGADA